MSDLTSLQSILLSHLYSAWLPKPMNLLNTPEIASISNSSCFLNPHPRICSKQEGRERIIGCLHRRPDRYRPTTQVCVVTGNGTRNLLVNWGLAPNEPSGQGSNSLSRSRHPQKYHLNLTICIHSSSAPGTRGNAFPTLSAFL